MSKIVREKKENKNDFYCNSTAYWPVTKLHVFKHINPPLSVAFPHLPQGLVLVSALLHILLVDLVHRRLSLEKTKDRKNYTVIYYEDWDKKIYVYEL